MSVALWSGQDKQDGSPYAAGSFNLASHTFPERVPMIHTIDADRLWQSIMDIAEIGPTPEGGSCRLALSPEDTKARALFLGWPRCWLMKSKIHSLAFAELRNCWSRHCRCKTKLWRA